MENESSTKQAEQKVVDDSIKNVRLISGVSMLGTCNVTRVEFKTGRCGVTHNVYSVHSEVFFFCLFDFLLYSFVIFQKTQTSKKQHFFTSLHLNTPKGKKKINWVYTKMKTLPILNSLDH